MNAITVDTEEDTGKHSTPGHGTGGPAPKEVIVSYGFWIFLLSDIIMFSALFAAYAVLSKETAGGPGGRDLFELRTVAIETGCLLASTFACGMMTLAMNAKRLPLVFIAAAVTFVLGAIFVGIELNEFISLIGRGAGPQRSAFLSSFFTLVGAHGLHVSIGLFALVGLMIHLAVVGLTPAIERRITCFTLYWHALDIVWVALFTVVYLLGSR